MTKKISRSELIALIKEHLNKAGPDDTAYDIVLTVASKYGIDVDSATKAAAADPEIKQAIYDSAVANRMIKP